MKLKDLSKGLGRKDIFRIDPRVIEIQDGFNLRSERPDLEEYIDGLVDYIRNNGNIPGNLTVKMINNVPMIRDGHCRLRAVRKLIEDGFEIKSVPCESLDQKSNEADELALVFTTSQSLPLTQLEQAEGVKRFRAMGFSNIEIAKKIGKSASTISNLLNLASAPVDVKAMVKSGEVSATTAVRSKPEAIKKAVEKARTEGKARAVIQVGGKIGKIRQIVLDWRKAIEGNENPILAGDEALEKIGKVVGL